MSNRWELYTLWGFVALDLLISIILIAVCISSYDLLSKANKISTNSDHETVINRYITIIMSFQIFSVIVVAYSIYYWYVLYHKVAALHGWIQKEAQHYWIDIISAIVIMAAYACQFIVVGLAFVPLEMIQFLTSGPQFSQDNLDALKNNAMVIVALAIVLMVIKGIKSFWTHGWKISSMNAVIEENLMALPQGHTSPSHLAFPSYSYPSSHTYHNAQRL